MQQAAGAKKAESKVTFDDRAVILDAIVHKD
jgi:hypothetical protein